MKSTLQSPASPNTPRQVCWQSEEDGADVDRVPVLSVYDRVLQYPAVDLSPAQASCLCIISGEGMPAVRAAKRVGSKKIE